MDIIDIKWNAFYVPIPRKKREGKRKYIKRVRNCLIAFCKKNTRREDQRISDYLRKASIESLLSEKNFGNMWLEGMPNMDVKYNVNVAGEFSWGPEGVFVWAHNIEDRKPMMEYLRQKWKEFQYEE